MHRKGSSQEYEKGALEKAQFHVRKTSQQRKRGDSPCASYNTENEENNNQPWLRFVIS